MSVRSCPRSPIKPRDGMLNSMRTRPEMVVDHFLHFAATRAEEFHHDADEIFRAIDDEDFEWLDASAVFGAHHDFGFAYHHLITFAAHRLDQDRELQFAAA